MRLDQVRVCRVGPFEDVTIRLTDEGDSARPMTVIYGDGGTGKTSLLSAIASTRPGRCTPLHGVRRRSEEHSFAVCHWQITREEPERPHPLVLASPNAKLAEDEGELLRRREQAHFDRIVVDRPGYAFLELPTQRTYARSALSLSDPTRTLMRYDVRGGMSTDPSRLELGRAAKQSLSYAAIASALYGDRKGEGEDPRRLGAAMHEAVDAAARLGGHRYRGVETYSLEPLFVSPGGAVHLFDSLPTQLKYAVGTVAIAIRTLWSANRAVDPREAEGVVAIDDLELCLGPMVCAGILAVLRRALPSAQWIVTTSSPVIAAQAETHELLTLRRQPDSDDVELYTDELALTH